MNSWNGTSGRRLIVNADDFGLSAGVNRGILEAYEAGVVSSVSLFVNTPAWEEAARRGRAEGHRLGVGLHLNLTAGRPLARVPSLTDRRSGNFHALPALVGRALAGLVDPADVVAECAAQLARLRDAGVPVTHLDSHRHVHVLPRIWAPVVEAARRGGVAVVRLPLEPLATNPGNSRALLRKAALACAWRLAAGSGVPPRHADHFSGLSLEGRPRFLERLLAVLDGLEPGTTELMVHPGYAGGGLEDWDDYTWQRERELRALLSPEIRARFARRDFDLTHFGAL